MNEEPKEETSLATVVDEVKTAAGETVALGKAIKEGNVEKVIEVFDDDKDGWVSWSEIKNHKWTIAFILANLMSIGIGRLLGNWSFVTDHWQALIAILVAFVLGILVSALFHPVHSD